MRRVTIDPITRLEGHGKIDIFLDENGAVRNAYLQVPELRGFEQFCVGRPAEEMPNLTARICGVCPEAHHMAAAKALDDLFGVEVPPTGRKLRELLYSIFYATDHTTHFYALGAPDFVMGPDCPPAERNILGVVKKVGMEIAGKVLKMRKDGHALIKMMGGRPVHPNWCLPGGVSRGITEEQRVEIEARGREAIEFAQFSLQIFGDIVLANDDYLALIKSGGYIHKTYNMGMVDAERLVNFYDGKIRITGPDGSEHAYYHPSEYREYIDEHVEEWSYLKFPYLRKVGWKGFEDGEQSGIYKATPLSRLNVAEGMATPLANEQYERVRALLRDTGRQAGERHAGDALGAAGGAALRRRALGGTGDGRRDHRAGVPGAADGDARRRHRLRGSAARHAHASLHHRRPGDHHQRQPDRGYDQQQRADQPVDPRRGQAGHHQGPGGHGTAAEHGRDGVSRLRPLFRLRDPHPARTDAFGGALARTGRRDSGNTQEEPGLGTVRPLWWDWAAPC
jgi:coenzyme F420-reducing hydrogenase alpha subunit